MINPCTLCNAEPNIKINKLNYCTGCFEKNLVQKIYKHLRGFKLNSNVLIYLDGTASSLAMIRIINMMKHKNLHNFTILANSSNELQENYLKSIDLAANIKIIQSKKHIKYDPLPKILLEEVDVNNYDILIIGVDTEFESTLALKSICDGSGVTKSLNYTISNEKGKETKIINSLGGIKSKEIQYYNFINKQHIPNSNIFYKKTKLESTLLNYINFTNDQNSLTVFNILNTVKKICEVKYNTLED